MIEPINLATDRLTLRPFVASDAVRLAAIAGSRRVADTTISVPHPLSAEGAAREIVGFREDWSRGTAATFAITLTGDSDACVGCVAIRHIDREHGEGELSFWIEESMAGKGLITEAARAAVDYTFGTLELNRVCAYHMVRNVASERVLAKLGFVIEGRLRQRVRKWGVYEDVLLWAILRQDWSH